MALVTLLGALGRGLAAKAAPAGLQSVNDSRGGWFSIIREPYAGAWQRNEAVTLDTALSNPVQFRVASLICNDIAKMRLRLVAQDSSGIWSEAESASFSPVLRKPNHFQNRIQFVQSWMSSKLLEGNAVVLKERDNRGVVIRLYVLAWSKVKPLVGPDGSIWYQLSTDEISGLGQHVVVPASEVIHDRWNTFFHPLVGLSPVYACGLAALQAQEIQRSSTKFFQNGAQPGGVLTAAGHINDETAARIKDHWEKNYTGENAGRVAVLGDGLKYEAMTMNAVDSELIARLKWSGETICGCYGVPPYMAGVGSAPLNNNVQSLAELYYAQCLQIHIESMELCLDEGLGLTERKEGGVLYGTEFDLDDLLRMDAASQVKMLSDGVLGGLVKPNEGRKKLNLGPVAGGDQVYLQQQNFSLAALAKRDAKDDPFGKGEGAAGASASAAPAEAPEEAANDDEAMAREARRALAAVVKGFA